MLMDTEAAPQIRLKVVLIGYPAVGKTSIANRYTRNLFANRYINTMGCDFYIKNVHIAGQIADQEIKLVVHDIGGQVVFRSSRQKYMEGADLVFVVFALDDPNTYNIDEFLSDVDIMKVRPIVALLGNKVDLVDKDSLDLSAIETKAATLGVQLYLTSAKENIAVSDVFVSVVQQWLDQNGPK
jgi:small GTP-binding protein